MARYRVTAPAESAAKQGGVSAVDRALMVLGAFRSDDRALSLGEIAARTGLVKSTVLRLLVSLQHFGYVARQEAGAYTLGVAVARLHEVFLASFSLEAVVLPLMRELVAQTKEGAAFHVRQGDRRLCLHRVESPHRVREHGHAGDLLPLDRGTGGRVLLAFSGMRGALYDGIRAAGVAVMRADREPDLAGISAPVFAAGQRLVGALTLTMPLMRFDAAHEPAVRRIATAISRRLGAEP